MKQKLAEQYLDYASISVLYEETAPSLFAYIRSRLSPQEDAEDLLVEVFIAALEWKGFPLLTADEQCAWLYRVARNKIIDRYRQTGHLSTIALEYIEKTLNIASEENPEQTVVRQEELKRLQVTMHHLPPLQQQVLFLHFVSGLRCVEIASLLGKRDGAVRVLLSRALNRLRDIYSI